MPGPPKNKPQSPANLVARYASVMTLPASVAAGFLIGYALDYAFGTKFLRIVFLILGVVGGIVRLIQELKSSE